MTDYGALQLGSGAPVPRIAVYTAIAGGYDELKDHPFIPGCDFIAFSDRLTQHPAWQIRGIPDQPGVHPRMVAKWYKLMPHLALPEYDLTLWIDGSHQIANPHFLEEAIFQLGDSEMALYRHPDRDCIYDEADLSVTLRKYQDQPIREQVEHYLSEGHPPHWGLWACGTLLRRRTGLIAALMTAWWDEINRWSYQDQISLPVVLRESGFRPRVFDHHQRSGTWTVIGGHSSDR